MYGSVEMDTERKGERVILIPHEKKSTWHEIKEALTMLLGFFLTYLLLRYEVHEKIDPELNLAQERTRNLSVQVDNLFQRINKMEQDADLFDKEKQAQRLQEQLNVLIINTTSAEKYLQQVQNRGEEVRSMLSKALGEFSTANLTMWNDWDGWLANSRSLRAEDVATLRELVENSATIAASQTQAQLAEIAVIKGLLGPFRFAGGYALEQGAADPSFKCRLPNTLTGTCSCPREFLAVEIGFSSSAQLLTQSFVCIAKINV